jgi:DNA primase
MSVIGDDKIAEVRERASILEVVSDYVSLRKSGANYQGLCPFHGEKTPSFNVNPARGIFHCFGCGAGGNAITFVMKMEGLTFPEAVKHLAKKVGVVIEERAPSPAEKKRQDEREGLYRVAELAASLYRHLLLDDPAGEPGRRYLAGRGVDAATSEAYRLGFAPDRWDTLVRHLEQKHVPLPLAEKLGLVRSREGGGYYDTFRNRLLFTIADAQGRPIGFGGRVLDDSLPKYINSPESPIYHKSEVLFGVHLAKQAMREQDGAIVVEGYFDHLALYRAGVRNVVASCGTALTPGHLKLLKRYAGKLYTLFDADDAGKKATFRALDLVLDENHPAWVIELPRGEDPDSFVRTHGAVAFATRVAKARPLFEYYLLDQVKSGDTGNVAGRVRVVDELTPRLLKIANPVEREMYLSELSRLLGVNGQVLRKKLGRSPLDAADFSGQRPQHQHKPVAPADLLLALMAKFPEVRRRVAEAGVAELFHDDLLPVAEAMVRGSWKAGVELSQLLEECGSEELQHRITALLVDDRHLEEINPQRAFEECLRSLERKPLRNMKELARELARLDADDPRYREILHEMDGLRNRKSKLL